MDQLPRDLFCHILSYLSVEDFLHLSFASRSLRSLFEDDDQSEAVWKQLASPTFAVPLRFNTWKTFCLMHHYQIQGIQEGCRKGRGYLVKRMINEYKANQSPYAWNEYRKINRAKVDLLSSANNRGTLKVLMEFDLVDVKNEELMKEALKIQLLQHKSEEGVRTLIDAVIMMAISH